MGESVYAPIVRPRSRFPEDPGYVIAARTLDKCRAVLAGTEGDDHFDCPLDNFFFGFAETTGDDFKAFVATGATDREINSEAGIRAPLARILQAQVFLSLPLDLLEVHPSML